MSFPNIPDISPALDLDREDVANLLLASIAFEELGLAHLINAEAEKIQYVLETLGGDNSTTPPTIDNLLEINRSVEQTLRAVIKKQMLLQFKLEDTITIIPAPTITIKKYVSVDNGVNWHDANTPTGPTIVAPTNPMFRIVVTNTGNVTLTGMSVTDTDFGQVSIGGILAPGVSFEKIFTGTFALGSQSNTVTVSGTYSYQQVKDSDIAYYFGIVI